MTLTHTDSAAYTTIPMHETDLDGHRTSGTTGRLASATSSSSAAPSRAAAAPALQRLPPGPGHGIEGWLGLTVAPPPTVQSLAPLLGLRGITAVILVVGHFSLFWCSGLSGVCSFSIRSLLGHGPDVVVKGVGLCSSATAGSPRVPAIPLNFGFASTLLVMLSGFTLVNVYDTPLQV